MDERRVQAYLSLIQELLRYPSSHEEYILEEHRSLIDTDLLKIMEDMAEVLQAKRKVDEVDKIQAISKRLRNQLAQQDPNWVKYKVARQDHLLFKARKIIDSGIPDIKDSLYSLLSYNLEHLNLYLVTEIDNWIKDEIKKIQKRCLEIDRSIYDELLEYVDWKDPLESLELLGLAGLRKGLELVEAVVFPKPSDVQSDLAAKRKAFVLQEYQEICFLLQHLAAVFQDFNLGDISQNKEISIELINLWLSLVNPSDFPEGWGRAHQKLGSAYYYRIIGNRAENIDAAILSYEKALEIFNKNEFTQDFADIQAELATAYSNRIYGNESQNLERAIFAYRQAIEAQCFLKEAWIEDVFAGGVAMEQYEAFLQEALRLTDESEVNPSVVYPFLARQQDKLSEELIALIPTFGTRNNIIDLLNFANLVQQFRLGQRAVNLEIAIAIYTKALDFFDRQNDATTWANIQNDLGNAYSKRIRGERGENLEQAIRYYEAALTVYTPTAFPEDWAGTQNNLGNAYSNRIRGERGENLEQAIRYYEAALTVYTPTAFPEQWATTQNNLAAAYSNRIRGERGENLEQAIHCYEAALTVRTPTAFPEQWATTQNNLGIAYSNRIRGERGENLEQAIHCYEAALTVRTPTAFPEQWATTQNNLAAAYSNRIRGERGENLEQAIRYYEAALTVRTPTAFPEQWATTQNNLGTAYSNRIRGERGENLEQAIRYYKAALTLYTPTAFPEQWATTQNNLANAYCERIRGERGENLEQAIRYYKAALTVRTPNAYPKDWAMTQICLGYAYSNRIRGERGENLEQAIRCYEAALTIYTPTAFPEQWAMTQNNLGYAYSNRIRGERGENLEQAIRCYEAALTIYTPTAFPEQWAMTQNNLGAAYQKQAQSAPAIGCYRAALEIRTPSSFPLDCLQTGRNLGNFSYNRQDWEIAIEGYDNAIRAIEQSRNWATSPQTKQQLLENALPLYGRMIEACLHLERYEQALLTVERSKARTFTELLHNANRLPQNATPTQIQQYEQLNREIAALQYALDDQPPTEPPNPQPGQRSLNLPNPAPQTNPLLTLIQQRQTLLKEINDPTFNEFETVNPQLPDFSQLLTPTTAILEWFLPQDPDLGAYAFLITHQNHQTHIHPHRYSPTQRQALDQFNQTYNQDDRQTSWYEALEERLDHLTQLLDLPQILTHCPDPCYHLILIPHLYLHLYPLHALTVPIETVGADRIRPNPEGASVAPLQDCFEKGVRYAPSCQILAHLQKRDRTQPTAPFFAVQNPTQDLHYADVEIDLIRRRFDPAHILKHAAANKPAFAQPTTRAQLENSEIIHFACHGGFDSTNPLNSGLKLARDNPNDPTRTFTICDSRRFDIEQKDLTAAEIYRNLKLACRLVILSACETGRLDSRTTDEYIGLANALLYAGSNTVVDTRWPVDDGATAFLTIRFYEELTPTRTIPQALKAAQTWFRTITKADFLDWCAKTLQMSDNDLKECQLLMIDYDQDLPFAQRRYWAPFSVSGLP